MLRFIIILILALSLNMYATHATVSLQKALDKKWVTTDVKGRGGHQGFCINIAVRNLTKDSLVVTIEAGRRLNSIDDKNQDILIVKEKMVALKEGELKNVDIKGYCCQVSKHAPAKGAGYAINKLGDSDLVKLARFLNKWEFEENAEQEAVWAISDHLPSAHVTSENDSLTQGLREIVAFIKGEELPWYRIISKKYVYQNGVISFVYLRLRGVISVSSEKDDYVTLSVHDAAGQKVCQVKSEWLKAGANQTYKLDIPIKGLVKGRYSLEIASREGVLAHRIFEI